MPGAQLATAAIEKSINHLLKLDDEARRHLKPLESRRLKVSIKEFPWPLVFHFSERVDVLAQQQDELACDCHLGLSLADIETLKDSSQITRMIKQDRLMLDGDLQVAQGFSQLIQSIDIDWEEQLAKITGDVFAHSIFQQGRTLLNGISKAFVQSSSTVSDTLIEEKKWMAHSIMVEDFCQQVIELRSATERLEARLNLLVKTSNKDETP